MQERKEVSKEGKDQDDNPKQPRTPTDRRSARGRAKGTAGGQRLKSQAKERGEEGSRRADGSE